MIVARITIWELLWSSGPIEFILNSRLTSSRAKQVTTPKRQLTSPFGRRPSRWTPRRGSIKRCRGCTIIRRTWEPGQGTVQRTSKTRWETTWHWMHGFAHRFLPYLGFWSRTEGPLHLPHSRFYVSCAHWKPGNQSASDSPIPT